MRSATIELQERMQYRTVAITRRNHGTFIALAAAAWLRSQGRVFGARLDELGNTNSDALFDDSAAKVDNDRLTRSILLAYLAGMLFANRQYALSMAYTMDNIHILIYQQQHMPELVRQLNDTTKSDIRDVIDSGVTTTQRDKTIRSLFVAYETSRTPLIGQHESIEAFSRGSLAAVGDSGLAFEKLWLTANDDRVEAECIANAALGWVSLHYNYGGTVECPPQHVGCRCGLDFRRA